MQPALFDTSIYISALRRGNEGALALRRVAADGPLWLSSVVLEELYAGAGEREPSAGTRSPAESRIMSPGTTSCRRISFHSPPRRTVAVGATRSRSCSTAFCERW